ncbi:Metalloenzyme, LuxS/M16 peptidase-like protein [Mycotypha africana]|uniref:Metalloenzyme, LuxS/M16 peptidase-like protein n=1 Tax=Mycotypha africana TaxID=64632 RepID=UPI00230192B4|nr:Metalloenzyme, LuxS/M16 peptidase-like protein [Mycotypha africana]KAI8981618.1 Metalloenzyme, LuxS/M16 peptidase-like protein [Mycotypha africana]
MAPAIHEEDSDWEHTDTHYLFKKPIEKPANDERDYRLIRLFNQLEILLISDPETDRASAALDVHVGSLSDPPELQGLAHFCEHLLFMGTKKYPKENDYYSYLSEHSGHANAYTGTENTNYFFEVGHQWLEGALDRFSHFFIDPLFSESCTERELKAVDSEHKKNLQSDCWRIAQVEKSLSNPNHPWHMFETGNLETLMEKPKLLGIDIRDELLNFHDKYYSANIMKLAVIGRESLEQLTKWVVEKFSNVANKNIPIPSFEGHPLTKNELMRQIFVKSVKKSRTLDITFPFPDQSLYYESQPAHYISHLTGHEGPGSILSYLKKKNWATYLNSGMCFGGIGFGFFHVSVDLTEKGLEHYEDVVVSIFEYIEMLKESGVQKWIFDEIKSLAEMGFRFSEKCPPSQYTSFLAQQMQEKFLPQWILSGSCLLRKYNPELIEQHMDLLRPDNFRLTLASQEFPNNLKCTKVEKWYSTEYEVLPLSEQLLSRLSDISINTYFKLPAINEFIPSKLDVDRLDTKKKKMQPDLLKDTPLTRIWYKKDDTFWVPKTNAWIFFKNPLFYAVPRNAVILELFINLLTDSLSEYSYNAEVAGLLYYLNRESKGITLYIGGYSDKLPLLLGKVVDKMKHLKIQPDRFAIFKDELTRGYENFFMEAPYQHSAYYMSYALCERKWTCDDYLAEIKDLTIEEVQNNISMITSNLHIEGLIHGTLEKDEVIAMFQKLQDILNPRPLLSSQFIGERAVLLPPGAKYVYQLPVRDRDEVNCAINYNCQICNVTDIVLRNRLSLVAQIAQEPCFNQLRTREQLGYLVFSGIRRQLSQLAFRLIIQSERDPIYLENRVLEFLEALREIIVNMSEPEYESQINSLIAERTEKYKNLWEEGNKYWMDIESGYYEFDDVDKDVQELKTITKDSLLAFYDKFIMPDSPNASAFSVHLQSQKKKALTNDKRKEDEERKQNCSVDQLNATLKYLKIIDSKTMTEDKLKTLVTDSGGDTMLQNDGKLDEFLSISLKVREPSIRKQVTEKLKQGPSGLSKRNHAKLPEHYEIIKDINSFKQRMRLSVAAVPLYPFGNV